MNSIDTKPAKTNGLCLNVQSEKRCDYLEWDEYFMAMTFLELRRGAPSHNNNAAIILNQRKIIISMANSCLLNIDTSKSHEMHTRHAEYKALQKSQDGNVMYTTSFPCDKCAEAIAQAGIREIVFYHNNTDNRAKEICDKYEVTYRQFNTKRKRIELDFSQFCDD